MKISIACLVAINIFASQSSSAQIPVVGGPGAYIYLQKAEVDGLLETPGTHAAVIKRDAHLMNFDQQSSTFDDSLLAHCKPGENVVLVVPASKAAHMHGLRQVYFLNHSKGMINSTSCFIKYSWVKENELEMLDENPRQVAEREFIYFRPPYSK